MSRISPSVSQRRAKESAGETSCKPSPKRSVTSPGQHVDHALGQIEVRAARACLAFQVAVRTHQSADVGDMDPEAIAVQAQGIVGVLIALVVDGIGRQMGEVEPRLFVEIRDRQIDVRDGSAAAARMRIVTLGPVSDLDQGTMGALRSLRMTERFQDAAVLGLSERQTLDLAEPVPILGRRTRGGHALEEGRQSRSAASLAARSACSRSTTSRGRTWIDSGVPTKASPSATCCQTAQALAGV
jgi:hypothetical protein